MSPSSCVPPGSGLEWEIDPDRNAALLASVVDSGPDGVIVVDREGRVVLANRTASGLFGYVNEEFVGIQVDTLVPSRHRAGHRAHRLGFERRPGARPMGIGLDLQAQRKDGSAFPVEISLAGVVVLGERFTIATVRDVTERRAMRLELARYGRALDTTNDAIFLVGSSDYVIQYVNVGTTALTGYSRDELVGAPIELFTTPGDRKRFSEHVRPLVESTAPVTTFAAWIIRKDSRTIEIESAVTLLEVEGESSVFVLVARDVTERNGAERELLSQRDHYARLLGLLDEGMIEMTLEGRRSSVNDRFCSMVGMTRDAILLARAPLPWYPPDRVEENESVEASAMAGDDFQAELEFVASDGRRFPVLLTKVVLSDGEGKPSSMFMTFRDLAEERRAATSLADVTAQLALVADRERIARDLHDHVIQQLFAIGLTLEGLLVRQPDETAKERLVRSIAQLDRTMKEVRSSIFELSNDDDKGTFRSQIHDVLADSADVLGFRPTLAIDAAVDQLAATEVLADVVAVVREALSNVVKHAQASEVSVDVLLRDDLVAVVVADNGIGIATEPHNGRGLGNLRVRAERLGGVCVVERGVESGTVVRWTVPASRR